MNILLIGSGGREHALAWAIDASPLCDRLFCAPGNAGMESVGECVPVAVSDHDAVIAFCRQHDIGLVVVGPEAPLVAGLVDALDQAGIKAFGPSAAAARLEGSKQFTKQLCADNAIPTAAFAVFGDASAALTHAAARPAPMVIKADGLAAGKGVVVAQSHDEAETAIREMFSGRFGEAGERVVIEDYLIGEEASFFVLCDGLEAVSFGTAQDHKRIGEGDTGPNTGGMGAYSPAPIVDQAMHREIMERIITPTLAAMTRLGAPFRGFLYAGLMITADGPKLIEYNVRLGDPEAQVLLMRLADDLVALMLAAVESRLADVSVRWREEAAMTVVLAARGYPGAYTPGSRIEGLDKAASVPGVKVFHAGTGRDDAGRVIATGGRVLNVTALGDDLAEAAARAYAGVAAIDWKDGVYRRDIGWRVLKR